MKTDFETTDRLLAHLAHWFIPGLGHLVYCKDSKWWIWLPLVFIGLMMFIVPGVIAAILGHYDLAVKMGTLKGSPVIDSLDED